MSKFQAGNGRFLSNEARGGKHEEELEQRADDQENEREQQRADAQEKGSRDGTKGQEARDILVTSYHSLTHAILFSPLASETTSSC